MKKQIGIWLDFSEAQIITIHEGTVSTTTILSEIEHKSSAGGSHSPSPWGPVEVANEQHLREKRKHQEKAYFEQIMEAIKSAGEIYIFGPAEAKVGLEKAIKAQASFSYDIKAIETADSMTMNQKVAQVKHFFKFGVS